MNAKQKRDQQNIGIGNFEITFMPSNGQMNFSESTKAKHTGVCVHTCAFIFA